MSTFSLIHFSGLCQGKEPPPFVKRNTNLGLQGGWPKRPERKSLSKKAFPESLILPILTWNCPVILQNAVAEGPVDTIQLLLKHDANPNDKDVHGKPLVIQALNQGRRAAFNLLVKQKRLRINEPDRAGKTPLWHAAEMNDINAFQRLLAHPEINVSCKNIDGWPLLAWAISERRKEIAKLLISHPKVDVNQSSPQGWTPLMWATSMGRAGLVARLLKHADIKVNLADVNGINPLLMAIASPNQRVLKLLLNHPDIDIEHQEASGMDALRYVQAEGFNDRALLIRSHPKFRPEPNYFLTAGAALN